MKAVSFAIALICCAAAAEDRWLMSGSGSSDAASFSYETRVEPPNPMPGSSIRGGLFVNEGFHRYMADHSLRKLFGYDIRIDPMPDGKLRVTFGSLTISATKLKLKDPESWSQMALPRYPPPQVLDSGDKIALDLLVNPASGQKIVDYLTIRAGRHQDLVAAVTGPARDFTIEDVELTIKQPEIFVNGQMRLKMNGSTSGPVGSLYLPGSGRFIFSLIPRERFRRAGEVRGNMLTIEWGSSTYKLACLDRIVPGMNAYHLYVFHDPKSHGPEILLGSSDHPGL